MKKWVRWVPAVLAAIAFFVWKLLNERATRDAGSVLATHTLAAKADTLPEQIDKASEEYVRESQRIKEQIESAEKERIVRTFNQIFGKESQ